MAQNIIDVDTVGTSDGNLGTFADFRINNTFYLLAPSYYKTFYTVYLKDCLANFDGWRSGFHNMRVGVYPQRFAQCVARGLNNILFTHGIDFVGDEASYKKAIWWSQKVKFYENLKKAHFYGEAGGTSLITLNRFGKDIYTKVYRLDYFYPDIADNGELLSVKVYFDVIDNIDTGINSEEHYGICEERYYNKNGQPCVRYAVYRSDGNMQNEMLARPESAKNGINWENLPSKVRSYIKKNYPYIVIGNESEQLLPFGDSLGCYLINFTEGIAQAPSAPFGQPIADIIRDECQAYDQLKYFEKNEVFLGRGRVLLPEELWNKDDPNYEGNALTERIYQKVQSMGNDSDKITPIQLQVRANEMRTMEEMIYRSASFKLNVSASTIASFLSEGAGARTATEIEQEKTKTDTWISTQTNMLSATINQLLATVMRFYDCSPVSIVFKAEDQTSLLTTVKTYTDMYNAGAISPELFVKTVHKHLTQEQQQAEIDYLKEQKELRESKNSVNYTQATSEPQVVVAE